MSTGCILSDYIEHAMANAAYDKLDDGSFSGSIPPCKGVIAFGNTLVDFVCEHLLRSCLGGLAFPWAEAWSSDPCLIWSRPERGTNS